MNLQILQEPDTPAEDRANTAESERRKETPYELVEAPAEAKVGDRETWLYAYVHDEQGIGASTIYNYMFSDRGYGWRTRVAAATGGDRAATANQIAAEAAKTLQVKGAS